MLSGLTIRQVRSEEAALLLPLLGQTQALHVAARTDQFRSDVDAAALATFLREWLGQAEINALAAVSSAGGVVGYAVYEIKVREQGNLTKGSTSGYIHHIAVAKDWRGKGVGTRLVEDLKSRLRLAGISKIGADYHSFNEASAALMRKAGLDIIGFMSKASSDRLKPMVAHQSQHQAANFAFPTEERAERAMRDALLARLTSLVVGWAKIHKKRLTRAYEVITNM